MKHQPAVFIYPEGNRFKLALTDKVSKPDGKPNGYYISHKAVPIRLES
jgi:hypothetical protein